MAVETIDVDVAALTRCVRAADRAVLDVARGHRLRPMEAYLLVMLGSEDAPLRTSELAERISASTSQAKQLALALQTRGLVERSPRGATALTEDGRELAARIAAELRDAVRGRVDARAMRTASKLLAGR